MARPLTQTRIDYLDGKCSARGVYFKEHIKCSPHIWNDINFPSESRMLLFKDRYEKECKKLGLDDMTPTLGNVIKRVTLLRLIKSEQEKWK